MVIKQRHLLTKKGVSMTTKQMMEQIMGRLDSFESRLDAMEKGSATQKKVSKKKSASKKSEVKPQQTREERLTEKFGDKESRTKFVELRKKVAEEFGKLAKANDCYIPKKSYMKVLTATTESLNGKFNKAAVKKAFIAAAK